MPIQIGLNLTGLELSLATFQNLSALVVLSTPQPNLNIDLIQSQLQLGLI